MFLEFGGSHRSICSTEILVRRCSTRSKQHAGKQRRSFRSPTTANKRMVMPKKNCRASRNPSRSSSSTRIHCKSIGLSSCPSTTRAKNTTNGMIETPNIGFLHHCHRWAEAPGTKEKKPADNPTLGAPSKTVYVSTLQLHNSESLRRRHRLNSASPLPMHRKAAQSSTLRFAEREQGSIGRRRDSSRS